MARYKIDERIFDTEKAKAHWGEDTRWNGNNHISRATGSQWEHETLYLSAKGTYWVEHTSQWQGSTPSARILSYKEAATWLLDNGHELPDGLSHLADEISE